MAEVGSISIVRDVWSASDVFSKCVAVPASHKQRELDPLPDAVLESENPQEAYTDRFAGETSSCTWKVHSLLLPTEDVLNDLCRNLPIADRSFDENLEESMNDD